MCGGMDFVGMGRTDALIPKWVIYDDMQKMTFVDPKSMEAYFVEHTGIKDIPTDYVHSLNMLLDRMHQTIERLKGCKTKKSAASIVDNDDDGDVYFYHQPSHNFINEVVNVQLDFKIYHNDNIKKRKKRSSVYLSLIEVRPCAEGLGIFRIILWQLLQSCKHVEWDFGVRMPYPKTKELINRVTKNQDLFVDDGNSCMIISLENISRCLIQDFDILDKLVVANPPDTTTTTATTISLPNKKRKSNIRDALQSYKLILNTKSFPSAYILNVDQNALDARLENKKNKDPPPEMPIDDDVLRDLALMRALEKPNRKMKNLEGYFNGFVNFLLHIRRQFAEYGEKYRSDYTYFYDGDKFYQHRCKIAQFMIRFDADATATLHVLDILEALNATVQNLILWQILQCCCHEGLDFKMSLTVMRPQVIKRLFGRLMVRTDDHLFWFISYLNIRKLAIKKFDILDKIYHYDDEAPYEINPYEPKFPTEHKVYMYELVEKLQ